MDILSNDSFLLSLLNRIEPNMVINLDKVANFGKQYTNLKSIIKSIDEFIHKNVKREKLTLTSDLMDIISINNIIANQTEDLIFLSEIILFITSISSRKDLILEKASTMDFKLLGIYLSSVEKFQKIEDERISMMKSIIPNYDDDYGDTNTNNHDKTIILNTYNNYEKEIADLKNEIETIKKEKKDLEDKLRNKVDEYEYMEKSNKQNLMIQEQLTETTLKNTELLAQLSQKDLEIEGVKEETKVEIQRIKSKYEDMKKENEKLKEQMRDYENISKNYEKLKEKYRELELSGDKVTKDLLSKEIDKKNIQLDGFVTERKKLIEKIENLTKENYRILREKQTSEVLVKRYETELKEKEEERKDFSIIKPVDNLGGSGILGTTLNLDELDDNKKVPLSEMIKNVNVDILSDEKVVSNFEINGNNGDREELEKKIEELTKEFNEEREQLKKEIEEKEKLITTMNNEDKMSGQERQGFLDQIKTLEETIERLKQELKEKIDYTKNDLINQANEISHLKEKIEQKDLDFDNMKKKHEEENQLHSNEIEKLNETINQKNNEIDTLSKQKEEVSNQVNDITKEKEDLLNQVNELTKKNEELTIQLNELSKMNEDLSIQVKEIVILKEELDKKKSEIEQLSKLQQEGLSLNSNEIVSLREQINTMTNQIEMLNQEKNKSKEEYTIIVNELNTLKSTLEQKEKDIDSLSKEKEELEKDNTVKISLVKDNYEKEANDLKNTIASQDYIINDLKGNITGLSSMLTQRNNQLQVLQNQYTSIKEKLEELEKNRVSDFKIVKNNSVDGSNQCELPLQSLQGTQIMSEVLFEYASSLLKEDESK